MYHGLEGHNQYTQNVEVGGSSETFVNFYQSARRYVLEDSIVRNHQHQNLKVPHEAPQYVLFSIVINVVGTKFPYSKQHFLNLPRS